MENLINTIEMILAEIDALHIRLASIEDTLDEMQKPIERTEEDIKYANEILKRLDEELIL